MAFGFGALLYACVLMINAIAVLSEDRFLARSASSVASPQFRTFDVLFASVGWSSHQPMAPSYDNSGFGEQGLPEVKARMINLISAVRTLMRSA